VNIEDYVFSPSGKPRALTDKQEREIGERYREGVGAPTLAREYSVTTQTIYRSLQRQQINTVGVSGRPRNSFPDRFGYVWAPIDLNNPIEVAMQFSSGYLWVSEHRKVMANFLGRPLLSSEEVHHIDGDRKNNCIENLQLRQTAHGAGVKFVCSDCGSHNVTAMEI
jgi:hypothetical protein